MLLHRYSTIDYILKIPFSQSIKLIEKATEEETREQLFRLYLVDRPNMTRETAKSFNQYYDEHIIQNVKLDTRSQEEIMEDLLSIERK